VGALITAILFLVGRSLISLYVRVADVGAAYGVAGSIVVLLVWIYYSSQIFFFGAEVTEAYANRYGSSVRGPGGTRPAEDIPSPPESEERESPTVSSGRDTRTPRRP
jgi:membrane protein